VHLGRGRTADRCPCFGQAAPHGSYALDHALTCQPCLAQFWPRDVPGTEKEIDYFLNVDFVSHVALVAVLDEGGRSAIVGGGRYIVLQPGTAEVAFVVIDQRQGQGIGGALMKHLPAIARQAGLKEFVASSRRTS
jgi:GNAT superfamily N-acetyltransferase